MYPSVPTLSVPTALTISSYERVPVTFPPSVAVSVTNSSFNSFLVTRPALVTIACLLDDQVIVTPGYACSAAGNTRLEVTLLLFALLPR
ncbi:hypothetical protein D3C80_1323970 [compost metagenome]